MPLRGLDADAERRRLPQRGDDWIALGSTTQSPEANTGYFNFPYYVTQATWTSPATNRLLLEAGFTPVRLPDQRRSRQRPPDGIFDLIPVTEQSRASTATRPNFAYRARRTATCDNYAQPEQLARVGVVRHRRAQHEGRLPGRATQITTRRS